MATTRKDANFEREITAWNGWFMLVVNVLIVLGAVAFFVLTIRALARTEIALMMRAAWMPSDHWTRTKRPNQPAPP